MKLSDYELSNYTQELIDFSEAVKVILNYGKYAPQVITQPPWWKGKEGESCYAFVLNSDGSYSFYTYYWFGSAWIYTKYLSNETSLFYSTSTSVPIWIPVIDPIVAISDRSITSIKIALGAINSENVAVDSIYTQALSDSAITALKIASNAIIVGHLSANAVTTTALSSTAVTTDKIATNAITANKVAANAIIASHLTAGAVVISETAQIQDAIITNAKIGSVSANKITAGSIATIVLTIASSGAIQSDNYVAASSGYKLDSAGLALNEGTIEGTPLIAKLMIYAMMFGQ